MSDTVWNDPAVLDAVKAVSLTAQRVRPQSDEYQMMQAGVAPAGCRCTMTSPERMDTYDGPQPAEWEQADDCPVHPLAPAQPIILDTVYDRCIAT